MTRTNTIEITSPSTNNRSPLGQVFDAKLMPCQKHVYVISDRNPKPGDSFPIDDMPEIHGTGAIGAYETHLHQPHQPSDAERFEAGKAVLEIH